MLAQYERYTPTSIYPTCLLRLLIAMNSNDEIIKDQILFPVIEIENPKSFSAGEINEAQQLIKRPDTKFTDQNGNSALFAASKYGKHTLLISTHE